jgi:hypothetical protein
MEHRDSVITYWVHQAVLAAALAVPAMVFLAFAVQMPPQYQYVVQDAAARGGALAWALVTCFVYLALTLLLVRSVRNVDRMTIVVAFLTPGAFLASVFAAGVATKIPIIAAILAGLGLVLLLIVSRPPRVSLPATATSRRYLIFVAIAVGIYFVAGIATATKTVTVPREMGSLLILAISAGTLGVLMCLCALKPKFGGWGLVYLLAAGIFFGPNDHRVPLVKAKAAAQPLVESFSAWVDSRVDKEAFRTRNKPYPVILVSSEGGGIYAAAHAYGTLSAIQQRCPSFSQHVFAIVGVSGGAFGNMLFAGALDPKQTTAQGCTPAPASIHGAPVLADHLSPVLARLLLLEMWDRLTPGTLFARDRAQVLSDSFLNSAPNKAYSRLAIGDSFDPTGARPAVISVAVDVATGHRVVLSPLRPEHIGTSQWWPDVAGVFPQGVVGDQISLVDAVGLSARFPWITPTGRLPLSKNREVVLADGGYFENSGADTVFDLLVDLRATDRWEKHQDNQCDLHGCYDDNQIGVVDEERQCKHARVSLTDSFDEKVKWTSCQTPIFIIHLALASKESSVQAEDGADAHAQKPKQSFLADPLRALLATRHSRGQVALRHMSLELCGTDDVGPSACVIQPDRSKGMFRNDIEPDAWKLPLGWFMSPASFDRIVANTAQYDWFDYKRASLDPDIDKTDTEYLIYHLDPEAFDGLQPAP